MAQKKDYSKTQHPQGKEGGKMTLEKIISIVTIVLKGLMAVAAVLGW